MNCSSEQLNQTWPSILKSCNKLFKAGLLSDSLAIMSELIADFDNYQSITINQESFYKQINQIVRKTLPLYALLSDSEYPHRYALEIYRTLFPGLNPDPASLLYLDIYTILTASLQGYRRYAHYELVQTAGKILNFRSDDPLALFLHKSGEKAGSADLSPLKMILEQQNAAFPHETFVILELQRLWQQEGRSNFNKEYATQLLQTYLQFFHWIPSSVFINKEIMQQLGPLADKAVRKKQGILSSKYKNPPQRH